ncbi:hypothetical protein D5S18_23150 [Nocardia panacis]|uniref:Uncharacterized protein n=1 Tax=Nocardia panacis TaxID=2340916 RepID=A0A3A4JRE1_9NOCA|nr:hypothetical protein D5S18_23150 [Nocardia panacis]
MVRLRIQHPPGRVRVRIRLRLRGRVRVRIRLRLRGRVRVPTRLRPRDPGHIPIRHHRVRAPLRHQVLREPRIRQPPAHRPDRLEHRLQVHRRELNRLFGQHPVEARRVREVLYRRHFRAGP